MATVNLGRVGFVNKGTHSGATAYKVNDVVTYNTGTYACIQANTGQAPTNTSYWHNWVAGNAVHNTGDETIAGVKTFSSSIVGNITGNAGTATKLTTARTINGVSFDGSASINIEDRLGTAIASAGTTTLGSSSSGDTIHITGTTTITSFGASVTGVKKTLIFDGALTLTHNETRLILPASVNIVTAAGDSADFVCENGASGNWRCVRYTKSSISVAELGYLGGVTSAIQTQLDTKQTAAQVTASIGGVTSAIQTQLDTKQTAAQVTASITAQVTAAITAQKASSTVYGTAKIYLSGSDLYIVTT